MHDRRVTNNDGNFRWLKDCVVKKKCTRWTIGRELSVRGAKTASDMSEREEIKVTAHGARGL